MEQLIPTINKLQDVFHTIGESPIDLPQIVVIGSQSSGKSSVLESIVGRDFLPRGSGIVTRRPLVLQLHNTAHAVAEGGAAEEWGEFLHLQGQRFTDFDAIRTEIARETDEVTGTNKGISPHPINLAIYSPNVLNLTLVDLPGITKVPVGDQPADIEAQIRGMCMQFIGNPNALILAVTPANSDIANSDALQMAREVDREGMRTIGVLTKLDLMDRGTNALDALQGRIIPLRLGYVGVMNRSQRDIDQGVRVEESLRNEAKFFQTHPAYRQIASRTGVPFLTKNLNTVLIHHIRDCLPELKARINQMLRDVRDELMTLGSSAASSDPSGKGHMLLKLLHNFGQQFSDALDGRNAGAAEMLTELYGGARISFIFNEIFGKKLKELDPFEGLSDEDIRTAIRNATGPRPSLFVPEASFEILAKRQIGLLEPLGLQCVEMVYEELHRLTAMCESESAELQRFTGLRTRIVDVIHNMLRERLAPTQSMITDMIKIELAYINTNHPDFIGGSRAVAQLTARRANAASEAEKGAKPAGGGGGARRPPPPPRQANGQSFMSHIFKNGKDGQQQQQQAGAAAGGPISADNPFQPGGARAPPSRPTFGGASSSSSASSSRGLPPVPQSVRSSGGPSERESVETEIIKSLMSSYYDIVRKNFMDLVPKAIMHFLVLFAKDRIESELVEQLYRDELYDDLLRETDDVAARRKNAESLLELLKGASTIVNEVRDFNAFV